METREQSMNLAEYSRIVDVGLRRVVSDRDLPLYAMMEHHLGWDSDGGVQGAPPPRSLGAACLAACASLGGDAEAALPVAASIELARNFCEIHDDIQSGRISRGGRDAVWWRWGPAQAINVGDGMHALARLALFGLLDAGFDSADVFEAVRLLDQASLAACEGRFLDLEAQERLDMTAASYIRMADAKTGSLYACALEFGALAACADADARTRLAERGRKLGAALQILDDLRQLSAAPDAAPSDDVLNKKKLYPVVLAFEMATPAQRRRLGDYYFKRVLEPSDLRGLADAIRETGAAARAERESAALLDEALNGGGEPADALNRLIIEIAESPDAA